MTKKHLEKMRNEHEAGKKYLEYCESVNPYNPQVDGLTDGCKDAAGNWFPTVAHMAKAQRVAGEHRITVERVLYASIQAAWRRTLNG